MISKSKLDGRQTARRAVSYVVDELRKHGYEAAAPDKRRPSRLVAGRSRGSEISLAVHGISGPGPWLVSRPQEGNGGFTILVSFLPAHQISSRPACFIIPESDVAQHLKPIDAWDDGGARVQDVSWGRVQVSRYRDAWSLLALGGVST